MTKLHEEFLRGPVGGLRAQLASRTNVRGEIVLMLALSASENSPAKKRASLAVEVAALMKAEVIGEMDALKRIARERGIGKRSLSQTAA